MKFTTDSDVTEAMTHHKTYIGETLLYVMSDFSPIMQLILIPYHFMYLRYMCRYIYREYAALLINKTESMQIYFIHWRI